MINASDQTENGGNYEKCLNETLYELEFALQSKENLSQRRISNLLSKLRFLRRYTGKPFCELSEREVQELVLLINRNQLKDRDLSEATLDDYRGAVKKLYQHLTEIDVSWIKTNVSGNTAPSVDPQTLPQEQHIRELVENAKNMREAALAAFLWDTGARSGEAASVKWKHLNITESRQEVFLPESKTRPRTLPIGYCLQVLDVWYRRHPSPEPDHFIFHSAGRGKGVDRYAGRANKDIFGNGFRTFSGELFRYSGAC